MIDWRAIITEAERVERELRQRTIDLSEARKAGQYFADHAYDEEQMARYLRLLAEHPPVRSKRSAQHYRGIRDTWVGWRTPLKGEDKARAWFWGVRLAQSSVRGQ